MVHGRGIADRCGLIHVRIGLELMRRGSGERAIGTIYSANTLGAIVGVLLSIHVLMPLVGVKGVILAGAGIHLALGLSAMKRRRI
jgi:hypothetical protein